MTRLRWILVVMLLGLLLAVTAVLTSERSFRYAAGWAVDRVPELEAKGIRGRLLTGVQVDALHWRPADGPVLEIRHLRADWRTLPALTGRLRIPVLTIDTLNLHLPGAEAEHTANDAKEWPQQFALPLDLRIGEFTVNRAELWQGEVLLAHLVDLEGDQLVAAQNTISIVRLRGRGEPLSFDLEASVQAHGNWLLELSGTWELALDEIPDITGETRLTGTLRSLEISQQLQSAIGSASLQGTLRNLHTTPAFSGGLRIRHADYPEARVRLRGDWKRAALKVHEFDATIESNPLKLAGSATYDWSGTLPVGRVDIEWRNLELEGFTSEHGTVSLRGHPSQWQGVLESSALAGGELPPIQANVEFSGTESGVTIAPWTIDTPGGAVRGETSFDWSGKLRVAGSARAQGFNPGELFEDWPGELDISLEGEAVMAETGAIAWQLHAFNADGVLREQALTARASMQGEGGVPAQIDLRVDAGRNAFQAQGALLPRAALEWTLDAPALQAILPNLRGSLTGRGAIRGNLDAPGVAINLAGAIQGVQGQVAAEGIWHDGYFDGEIQEAFFSPDAALRWDLEAASGVVAGPDRLELARFCWREASDSRLCMQGGWQRDGGTELHANLDNLQLEQFARWLPAGLEYEGMFEAEAVLSQQGDEPPTATVTVQSQPGNIRQQIADEMVTLLAWERVRINGDLATGTLDANFSIALIDGGSMQGSTRFPLTDTEAGNAKERPLEAHLQGSFSDFDLLLVFLPELSSLAGRVNLDLTASGSRSNPVIRGTLDIEDGSAGIPRLGIQLTDMRLDVDSSADGIRLQAGARSGPGAMTFDALLRMQDGKLAGSGNLAGEQFEAVNLPEARLLVNPEIRFELLGRELRVDGEVMVPRARIEPRDFSAAVTPTTDQVLVDAAAERERADDWRIHARIRLVLGDNVHFSGYGLDGRIAGGLVLTETPGLPTRASGELQVMEGRYRVWGQELAIERGRLLYADRPLAQPGLDIRAVRRPQNVEVGVNARGTLEEPEFTLFSNPSMQQSEAMSWLVLGRPLTQAGGSEQELVDRASTELGLAGGELLLGELTRRLGVGDVGIERGASPEQAALVIGHYLSPRLYIAYGIGLFDPGSTLRLRYSIDRRWTIRGETGPRASSTDLIYTIER